MFTVYKPLVKESKKIVEGGVDGYLNQNSHTVSKNWDCFFKLRFERKVGGFSNRRQIYKDIVLVFSIFKYGFGFAEIYLYIKFEFFTLRCQ